MKDKLNNLPKINSNNNSSKIENPPDISLKQRLDFIRSISKGINNILKFLDIDIDNKKIEESLDLQIKIWKTYSVEI